jgi:hypothetical protein
MPSYTEGTRDEVHALQCTRLAMYTPGNVHALQWEGVNHLLSLTLSLCEIPLFDAQGEL